MLLFIDAIDLMRGQIYTSCVNTMILTYRFCVKGKSSEKRLAQMTKSVNQVWNWCGGAQEHAWKHRQKWPTYVDLARGLSGSSADLGVGSDTFQAIAKQWCTSRDKHKKRPRWRVSTGSRRSLGWVPFLAARAIRLSKDAVKFNKQIIRFWKHRDIPADIRCGSFSEDASGRWYLNLVCSVPCDNPATFGEVGIDLGLKDFASLSDGSKIENPRYLRKSAAKLARAQRAGRKQQARSINRKIAAQRRHFHHTESARIARANRLVVVGDVNSAALRQTKMAKSVSDAGWSAFRSMLRYKAIRHGAVFVEANERYSTQTCSDCGFRNGSPKGLKGLRVRAWECLNCGSRHDRDTNAALNILRSGRNAAPQMTESLPLREACITDAAPRFEVGTH